MKKRIVYNISYEEEDNTMNSAIDINNIIPIEYSDCIDHSNYQVDSCNCQKQPVTQEPVMQESVNKELPEHNIGTRVGEPLFYINIDNNKIEHFSIPMKNQYLYYVLLILITCAVIYLILYRNLL